MLSNSKLTFFMVLFFKLSNCRSEDDDAFYNGLFQTDSAAISEKVELDSSFGSTNPSSSEENFSDTEETQELTTMETVKVSVTESLAKQFTDSKYKIKEICAHFKHVGAINLNKMVDLWQTAYYQASQKVPCFKMFIRKLTMKEKQFYKQKYGNFEDAVEWEDCNLEIRSSMEIKKHFLQGCERGHGVLENIIVGDKNVSDDISKFFLKPESPDQWLVVQNLLLMRDCDTGDVIVFSRVPHKPRKEVIIDALKLFGETADGKFICGDQPPIKKKAFEVDEEIEENF